MRSQGPNMRALVMQRRHRWQGERQRITSIITSIRRVHTSAGSFGIIFYTHGKQKRWTVNCYFFQIEVGFSLA